MKYLITWKATQPDLSIPHFLKHGNAAHKDIKILQSWHVFGAPAGGALIETSNETALADFTTGWAQVGLELAIVPVAFDDVAKGALQRLAK